MSTTIIGWCYERDEGIAVYEKPIPLSKLLKSQRVDLGIGACPAVNDFNARVFTILSPYTFRLRAVFHDSETTFHPVYPDTEVVESVLKNEITFQPRSLWRDAKFPILQLSLPYIFLSNESVFINQLEPNRFNGIKPWSIIQGRFDISTWHRPINWAIEWLDTSKDIVIKRGDPLCQIIFETTDPYKKISVRQIERSALIEKSIKRTHGTSNKIKGTRKIIYDEGNRLNISELNNEED